MLFVDVMEFDVAKRLFIFLQKVTLASVPVANDKLILTVEGVEIIFKVYDVHYIVNSDAPKVNAIRISTLSDYYASGFQDIAYYVRG
jgi:hypothetical protein